VTQGYTRIRSRISTPYLQHIFFFNLFEIFGKDWKYRPVQMLMPDNDVACTTQYWLTRYWYNQYDETNGLELADFDTKNLQQYLYQYRDFKSWFSIIWSSGTIMTNDPKHSWEISASGVLLSVYDKSKSSVSSTIYLSCLTLKAGRSFQPWLYKFCSNVINNTEISNHDSQLSDQWHSSGKWSKTLLKDFCIRGTIICLW